MELRRAVLAVAVAAILVEGCSSTINVQAGDDTWTVACRNVGADDCHGIVDMYLNNLARNYEWVRDETGGTIRVDPAFGCPDFGTLGQPGACWRVSAPVRTSRACMILARRIEPLQGYRFVRIGGDELTGLVGVPAPGTTPC